MYIYIYIHDTISTYLPESHAGEIIFQTYDVLCLFPLASDLGHTWDMMIKVSQESLFKAQSRTHQACKFPCEGLALRNSGKITGCFGLSFEAIRHAFYSKLYEFIDPYWSRSNAMDLVMVVGARAL